ncbi:hypothetical protein FALCPG4_000157 [Fusarium falciforme]
MNSTASTPPSTPPSKSTALWYWHCKRCDTDYNISVTRRCLDCTATGYIGKSPSSPEARRCRIMRTNMVPLSAFDYEYWATYNDWRRFRSAYEKDPSGWKRRTGREPKGSVGRERRALMTQLERKRRIEITEERRTKFIKATYSCEKDCDYPSQCHRERWAAYTRMTSGLKCPGGQVVGGGLRAPCEDDEPKSPLCRLLPELEMDIEGDITMTSPESIDDDDEIINAYGVGETTIPLIVVTDEKQKAHRAKRVRFV